MHWMLMLFLTFCCSAFADQKPPQEMIVDGTKQTTTKMNQPKSSSYGDDFMEKPLSEDRDVLVEGTQEDVDGDDDGDYDDDDVDDEATEEMYEE